MSTDALAYHRDSLIAAIEKRIQPEISMIADKLNTVAKHREEAPAHVAHMIKVAETEVRLRLADLEGQELALKSDQDRLIAELEETKQELAKINDFFETRAD